MLSTLRKVVLPAIGLILSCNFLFAQNCSSNLIGNPGFESGTSNWSLEGSVSVTTDALSGSNALEIAGDGNRIFQTLAANPGQVFTLDASWKKLGANGTANMGFKFLDSGSIPIEFDLRTLEEVSDYVSIETIVATAPAQTVFMEVTVFTNAISSAIRVDDFCLTVEGIGSGQKPDLIVENLRSDGAAEAGGPLDLTFDLGNIGSITAFGDLQAAIYLSEDQQLSTDDRLLISETYSNIPVGGTNDLTALMTIPMDVTDGEYFLIVKADNEEEINEENENNNVANKALRIGDAVMTTPCAIELNIVSGSVNCEDNNTPDDPSDDLWSLRILPKNTANPDANGWRATAGGQSYSGAYDQITTLTGFSISEGAIDIVFEDEDDNQCTKELLNITPPDPCSNGTPPPPCELEATFVLGTKKCDDNGTDLDDSDDTWSLEVLILNTANPAATGWSATANGLSFSGAYGSPTTLAGFKIADGNLDISIVDQENLDCTKSILNLTPPATCSNGTPPPTCDFSVSVLNGSISCDDNGTDLDDSDDNWSFVLTTTNTANPNSTGWKATVNGTDYFGNWGAPELLAGFKIADGPIELTISELDNLDCNESLSVDPPATCSNGTPPPACDFSVSVLSGSISCDDNGTDLDDSDDNWSFVLTTTNTANPNSTGWKATVNGTDYFGNWGTPELLAGFKIADGPIELTISELDNLDCNESLSVDPPATCSNGTPPPACDFSVSVLSGSISCDDNGTDLDESDDNWSFVLITSNTANPNSTDWKATVNGVEYFGIWGNPIVLEGFKIADGAIELTIAELDNLDCNESINIDPPATCSNGTPPPPPNNCTGNLLMNGDFENGITDWNNLGIATSTDDAFSGNAALQIEGDGNRVLQTLEAAPGNSYTLNAVGKLIGNGNAGRIGIKFLSNTYQPLVKNYMAIENTDFTNIPTIVEIAPALTAFIEVTAFSEDAGAALVVDEFCLTMEMGNPPNPDQSDLVITALQIPTTMMPGETYELSYTLGNIGTLETAAEFEVAYYLSMDDELSSDDERINTDNFGIIEKDEFLDISTDFMVPPGLTDGTYYVIVNADDSDMEMEELESNNFNSEMVFIESGSVNPPDCPSYSLFPWEDYIKKVKINEEGLSSGKSEYSDFTNIVFDVPLEESNAIELTAGFSWRNYDEYFRVYIDFNGDGSYGNDEIYFEEMLPAKANGNPQSKIRVTDFMINPTNATLGLTTMRVMMSRDGFPGPCDILDFGEVEDYAVNLVDFLTYNPYETRAGMAPDQLVIYPNPASEFININLGEAFGKNGKLLLVNALGQVVVEKNLQSISEDIYNLPVAEFISGAYTIYVKVDGSFPRFGKVMVVGEY